jgi:hypothetical protein
MTTEAKCAHEICACSKPYSAQTLAMGTAHVDPNAKFCTKRCEEMAGGAPSDDGCECGHPECEATHSKGIPPMQ